MKEAAESDDINILGTIDLDKLFGMDFWQFTMRDTSKSMLFVKLNNTTYRLSQRQLCRLYYGLAELVKPYLIEK